MENYHFLPLLYKCWKLITTQTRTRLQQFFQKSLILYNLRFNFLVVKSGNNMWLLINRWILTIKNCRLQRSWKIYRREWKKQYNQSELKINLQITWILAIKSLIYGDNKYIYKKKLIQTTKKKIHENNYYIYFNTPN